MYSTCTFCNKPLGSNEVFEQFPVGLRIAFDSARGRLWVVCRSCERWNLSPLEERWEIVEECERTFSETRLRTSTEHIGLARVTEGLELVRIGSPMRPEFAAWRYGDQFGRRRRNAYIKAGLITGAVGAVAIGMSFAAIPIASFGGLLVNGTTRLIRGSPKETVAVIPKGSDLLEIKRKDLKVVALISHGDGWGLTVPVEYAGVKTTTVIEGGEAKHALGLIMPAVNQFAGKKSDVGSAVALLEMSSPDMYAEQVARRRTVASPNHRNAAPVAALRSLPYPVRLALEMATHEEAERRALEGELAVLEEAWRQAEEIADISDNLLLPDSLTDKLRDMR